MKCQSNKIAAWLDEAYRLATNMHDPALYGPVDWQSYYDGAIAVLETTGFNITKVPCGKSLIHIVNPSDTVNQSGETTNGKQMKLEI